jgi:hypothetical protein
MLDVQPLLRKHRQEFSKGFAFVQLNVPATPSSAIPGFLISRIRVFFPE